MRKTLALLVTALILSSLPPCAQAEDGLPVAKTKVRTLAAFKNGLSFVFRSGEAQLKDGWAVLDEIPNAALGALWIGTSAPNARVDEVVSYKGSIPSDADVLNLGDLLEANVGNAATVFWATGPLGEVKKAEGKIIAVPRFIRPEERSNPNAYNQGQMVMIQTSNGAIVSISKNMIQSVEMGPGTKMSTKVSRDVSSAKAHVTGSAKSVDLTVTYLGKGITWSPSYLVNIKNDKEADITLEAVLVNDTEDLENTEVSFVVGYPNFAFADTITPMSALQSVAAFIQALTSPSSGGSGGGFGGGSRGSMAAQQSVMFNSATYDRAQQSSVWNPDTSYLAANLPGESNEDLFFYKQQNVTLRKGERGRYSVLSAKAPYTHLYQWEVRDTMYLDDWGNRQSEDRSRMVEDQVWHVLKIENTSQTPWTTAPAFAVNGAMPVAQDVLKYTPPKGKSTMRLTVATDVRAEQSQIELSRENKLIGSNQYDEITVDGALTVKNLKSKEITINVKKSLTGGVVAAGQDGKISKVAKRLTAVNSQSEIVWEFPLGPGVEKKLTYQYKVLLRR